MRRFFFFSFVVLYSAVLLGQTQSEEADLSRSVWNEGEEVEDASSGSGSKGSGSGTENEIPIDGGIVALVAAGSAYLGLRKSRVNR